MTPLIAAATAGLITAVHPVCEITGHRLLIAVNQGWVTNEYAAKVFLDCQRSNPHPPQ